MQMPRFIVVLLALSILAIAPRVGCAADTTFTYQGELKSGENLANGSFNMTFSLFNALAAGTQIGSTLSMPNVAVSDGTFTVQLDFGANAFDNSGRWLQISVNSIVLSPRQELTRSPYSIQTRGIFVNDQKKVGIGTTTPNANLHVQGNGDGAVVRITNGSGGTQGGSTALIIGDTFGDARAATLYGITSNTLMDVRNDGAGPAAVFNGFVGVGRSNPVTSAEVFGIYKNTTGFGGMYVETPASGRPFYGYSAGGEADAYSWYEGPTNIWRLTIGSTNRLAVNGNTGAVNITGSLGVSGSVSIGSANIHPAFAYGKVAANGGIINASSNVASVTKLGPGHYRVFFSTPLTSNDVLISSSPLLGVVQTLLASDGSGSLEIATWEVLDGSYHDVEFSFVVYRP